MEKTRQVLQAQLNKLDLVSREEFDVQTKGAAAHLPEKLTALEAKAGPARAAARCQGRMIRRDPP